MGGKKWILVAAVMVGAMGCASSDETSNGANEGNGEEDVVTLSAEQQSLADLAMAEVHAAAERFDGEPNLLVALRPNEGSKLTRVTAIPIDDEAIVKSALAAAGASNRGAARMAGLVRSLRFRGQASIAIWAIAGGGFVLHTIDRKGECSFATVSAFDVEGDRVARATDDACS